MITFNVGIKLYRLNKQLAAMIIYMYFGFYFFLFIFIALEHEYPDKNAASVSHVPDYYSIYFSIKSVGT